MNSGVLSRAAGAMELTDGQRWEGGGASASSNEVPPVPSLAGFGMVGGLSHSAGEGTGGTVPVIRRHRADQEVGTTKLQRHILQLDALLGDPVGQREAICLALQRLVGRVALRVEFPSAQCREELTQDVFLYCLGQVGKQPREAGRAYHWFSLVAKRKFWARLRWERKRAAKSLSTIDHDRARLRPVERITRQCGNDLQPLMRGSARQRVTEYLDDLLDRTLAQHRTPTDAVELQITRGMVLALQEVRRRVTGTYRRLAEEDLGYTERYRVEREDC